MILKWVIDHKKLKTRHDYIVFFECDRTCKFCFLNESAVPTGDAKLILFMGNQPFYGRAPYPYYGLVHSLHV